MRTHLDGAFVMHVVLDWLQSVAFGPREALVAVSATGAVLFWNVRAEQLFGYSADEATGRSLNELIPPRRGAELDGRWLNRRQVSEPVDGLSEERLSKAGRAVAVRTSIERILYRDAVLGWGLRFRALEPEDEMSRRVRHVNRLAVLGTLIATVAHEMRTPLTTLLSTVELMESDAPRDPASRESLEDLRAATLQLSRVVADLRVFSGDGERRSERVDLVEIVQLALRLSSPHLRSRARMEVHLQPGLVVLGDATRLTQVVINLLNNAADALMRVDQNARRLEVEVAREDEGAGVIRVRDSGPGVPPEVRAQIFEAFFTTKPSLDGSGLGLAIARTIADEHGGTLSLEPTESGAEFALRIPLA